MRQTTGRRVDDLGQAHSSTRGWSELMSDDRARAAAVVVLSEADGAASISAFRRFPEEPAAETTTGRREAEGVRPRR